MANHYKTNKRRVNHYRVLIKDVRLGKWYAINPPSDTTKIVIRGRKMIGYFK